MRVHTGHSLLLCTLRRTTPRFYALAERQRNGWCLVAGPGSSIESLQIHGGYGYMRECGIERAVRDARLGPIGGGTDEILKEIVGKTLGL